jgi:hypothetical protein
MMIIIAHAAGGITPRLKWLGHGATILHHIKAITWELIQANHPQYGIDPACTGRSTYVFTICRPTNASGRAR